MREKESGNHILRRVLLAVCMKTEDSCTMLLLKRRNYFLPGMHAPPEGITTGLEESRSEYTGSDFTSSDFTKSCYKQRALLCGIRQENLYLA